MAVFIGIDVQVRRPCAAVIIDEDLQMIASGWLCGENSKELCEDLFDRLLPISGPDHEIEVGIDAPRQPLVSPRKYYWNRNQSNWRERKSQERGWGRHCEVVIRGSGIANPQWTPTGPESPDWMKLGYGLFQSLEEIGIRTHEVFPSASYATLEEVDHLPVSIRFSDFRTGPKDMLDACCAAFTVHEFARGRGSEVGNDGLGTIVLPRPLPEGTPPELLDWPGD